MLLVRTQALLWMIASTHLTGIVWSSSVSMFQLALECRSLRSTQPLRIYIIDTLRASNIIVQHPTVISSTTTSTSIFLFYFYPSQINLYSASSHHD